MHSSSEEHGACVGRMRRSRELSANGTKGTFREGDVTAESALHQMAEHFAWLRATASRIAWGGRISARPIPDFGLMEVSSERALYGSGLTYQTSHV